MMRRLTIAACALAALACWAPAAQGQARTGGWGRIGETPGRFQELKDVTVDSKGYVYTLDVDGQSGRVQKFTSDGRLVRQFGRPQDEDDRFDTDQIVGALYYPEGLAIGPGDNVYVSEDGSDRTRISVWSPRGKFLRSFGAGGSGPGQIASGAGLTVDGAGNVFVADFERLGVFNARGGWLGGISEGSDSPVSIASPSDVALSGTRLFAAERDLVKVWNTNNTPVGGFGGSDSADPGLNFSSISSLAFSGSTLYIADFSLSRVQAFAVNGNNVGYLRQVGGTPGSQPGQFTKPVGVATDCRGSVYVADSGNYRVQKFGTPGAKQCVDVAKDKNERFLLKLGGKTRQKFRTNFAVRPVVTCDRPCNVSLTGTIKIRGRKAIKLTRQREALEYPDPTGINVAPGEKGTDRVASAVKRRRSVVARVTLTARDLTGRKRVLRKSYRLR